MIALFGQRRPAVPPVPLPAATLRPGRNARALVEALQGAVDALRFDCGYALAELDPDAVRAYAAQRYLACVARAGHAAYLADPGPEALQGRAQEGLERALPALFAELHETALGWADCEVAEAAPAIAAFDEIFRKAGGPDVAWRALAVWIETLGRIEAVPEREHARRLRKLARANPHRNARRRDLAIARLDRRLTEPLEAGAAIVLARTAKRVTDFAIEPAGVVHFGDGGHAVEWTVTTSERDFVAVKRSDRVIVYRVEDERGGRFALGNLHEGEIAVATGWARRGHVALAAVLGLEKLEMAERLTGIVFEQQRTLKSGNEAAAFHMALDGRRDLALVVFRGVSAVVEPRTNDRLAELDHATLAREQRTHTERLVCLTA